MKILHFIFSVVAEGGGPAEGLRQFCAIYKTYGHEVEVVSLDSPDVVQNAHFPVIVHGLGPGVSTYGYSRQVIPWLKTNIQRYDMVLINGIWQYNLAAAFYCLKNIGIPFAIFTHGMLDPYFRKTYPLKHIKKTIYWHGILKGAIHKANLVFFTSEEEKNLARQSFSGYQAKEAVIPYGIFGPVLDSQKTIDGFYANWPALRGKRLALHMGRIHPKKGIDILIESFSKTLAQDSSWHLVIAGPDQIGMQKKLEKQSRQLGIANRITWTGMLKDALKWGAYATAEVFVMPSHQENFGIVVAEALSCGLPVILSNKVNIWREVMSYWAGLVNEDTVDGTVASLRRWMTLSQDEVNQLRIRSRKCFSELFDYKSTAAKINEYIELLGRSNPRYKRLD